MYIVVHYLFPVSPGKQQNGQRCQTISSLWPDVSARQSWRKRQTSHRRQNPARMPRNSSPRNPGRQTRGRNSSPGSGDGMTAGTVPRHRAGTRQGSATISGGIIPSGRSRRPPLKREQSPRTAMQVRTRRDTTAPPSRAGTTGAAGPRERLSKNGPVIFTANKNPRSRDLPISSGSFFYLRSPGTSVLVTTRTPIFSMSRRLAL